MTTRRPTRLALLRVWLSGLGGFGPLAVVALLFGLGYTAYFLPLGPPEHIPGTVQDVEFGALRNNRAAYVRVGPETIVVSVSPNTCRTGDHILLDRQRRLWGDSITADPLSCGSAAAQAPAAR